MIEGLGDFVVAHLKTPPIAWADTANSLFWPKQGPIDIKPSTLDITPTLKAAYSGAVDCVKSADGWRIKLEQAFGGVDSTSVIDAKAKAIEASLRLSTSIRIAARWLPTPILCDRSPYSYWKRPTSSASRQTSACCPDCGLRSNRLTEAIYHHLNFAYIPTPFTIYDAIRKVPAGSKLTIDTGSARIDRYWQPRYPEDLDGDEEKLAGLLRDSLQLVIGGYVTAETDPACYLSGGTDSSTIASILAKSAGPERTHAFSIGFTEKAFDELDYAGTAAKAIGIDHHQRRIGVDECLAAIDILIDSFDEPFGQRLGRADLLLCGSSQAAGACQLARRRRRR